MKHCIVHLSGPGIKRGFLKAIVGKFGRDLSGLNALEGISEVKLSLGSAQRSLSLSGAVEQIEQVNKSNL